MTTTGPAPSTGGRLSMFLTTTANMLDEIQLATEYNQNDGNKPLDSDVNASNGTSDSHQRSPNLTGF